MQADQAWLAGHGEQEAAPPVSADADHFVEATVANLWALRKTPMNLQSNEWHDALTAKANEERRLQETAGLYCERAAAWRQKREWAKALEDYAEAIRLHPESFEAWKSRAWIRATCDDPRFRDGKQALQSAETADEVAGPSTREEWQILETLAAAQAELGDFTQAVGLQTEALETMTDREPGVDARAGAAEIAAARSRLALYESGQPCRESAQ